MELWLSTSMVSMWFLSTKHLNNWGCKRAFPTKLACDCNEILLGGRMGWNLKTLACAPPRPYLAPALRGWSTTATPGRWTSLQVWDYVGDLSACWTRPTMDMRYIWSHYPVSYLKAGSCCSWPHFSLHLKQSPRVCRYVWRAKFLLALSVLSLRSAYPCVLRYCCFPCSHVWSKQCLGKLVDPTREL